MSAIKKVLVIEDDLAQRPLWEMILRRNFGGVDLEWAVSSEEAMKLYKQSIQNKTPFDFLIADLFLAGPDTGLDFIQKVKSISAKIPILLVSSVDELELKKLCATKDPYENFDILAKPLSVPQIERKLQNLI